MVEKYKKAHMELWKAIRKHKAEKNFKESYKNMDRQLE